MQSVSMVRFIAILAIAVFCSVKPAWSKAPEGGYTFGIGPVQSATELAKRWAPFLDYVSKKSGVPLQFATAKDISTYQQQLIDGVYDFGYINPYHYLASNKSSGYTAFAREKGGKLSGILVVRKDDPIRSLTQLSEKTVAFPSANALASTWLPVNMLEKNNITVIPQYVNSMDSVYIAVVKGIFPAGGGETRTFGTLDPAMKDQLRILWTSDPLPPFPFISHPRISKSEVAKVQKAMEQMSRDPEGMELLKVHKFKGIERSKDADYDVVRKMNLKPLKAQ
jgi:phosphonate transport system substrate-binding protein